MKIAVRNSDDAVVMVADCTGLPEDQAGLTVHEVPRWDWSLADMRNIDTKDPNWLGQFRWNGTTLVPK